MDAETLYDSFLSLGDVALGTGARLLFIGAYRRSASGVSRTLIGTPAISRYHWSMAGRL